jgi:peptide/nickel transport system permease protein
MEAQHDIGTLAAEGPGVGAAAMAGRPPRRDNLFRTLTRQRLAVVGGTIVGLFAIISVIGPFVAPYDPLDQDVPNRLMAPSLSHWMGTDEFGRDVFSRLLSGAIISFQVGVVSVGLSGVIGVVFGLIAGYFRGKADAGISLIMDVIFAFPTILLAIALVAVLGSSLTNVMLAIGIVNAPTFYRVVRGSVLSVRQSQYVEAAVSLGTPVATIMRRHIFPNITAPLIVHSSLNFAAAVLSEAALSYLGLGNRPPSPSWGLMVSSAYGFLDQAPWATLFPGIAIALIVLGFNLLGDGLRDALDPRLRGR